MEVGSKVSSGWGWPYILLVTPGMHLLVGNRAGVCSTIRLDQRLRSVLTDGVSRARRGEELPDVDDDRGEKWTRCCVRYLQRGNLSNK